MIQDCIDAQSGIGLSKASVSIDILAIPNAAFELIRSLAAYQMVGALAEKVVISITPIELVVTFVAVQPIFARAAGYAVIEEGPLTWMTSIFVIVSMPSSEAGKVPRMLPLKHPEQVWLPVPNLLSPLAKISVWRRACG